MRGQFNFVQDYSTANKYRKKMHETKLERHSGTNGSALKRRFHSCWLEPAQMTSSGFTCILVPSVSQREPPNPEEPGIQAKNQKPADATREHETLAGHTYPRRESGP